MQTYITDFGEIEAPDEATATELAYEAWERMHFRMGGWKGLSEEEFEKRLAERTLVDWVMSRGR